MSVISMETVSGTEALRNQAEQCVAEAAERGELAFGRVTVVGENFPRQVDVSETVVSSGIRVACYGNGTVLLTDEQNRLNGGGNATQTRVEIPRVSNGQLFITESSRISKSRSASERTVPKTRYEEITRWFVANLFEVQQQL